jgi:hypothetical protein
MTPSATAKGGSLEERGLVEELCADPRKGSYPVDKIFEIQDRRLELADLIGGRPPGSIEEFVLNGSKSCGAASLKIAVSYDSFLA